MTFYLMFAHIMLLRFGVAGWLPFGKELLTQLTICSVCILTISNFSYFTFRV